MRPRATGVGFIAALSLLAMCGDDRAMLESAPAYAPAVRLFSPDGPPREPVRPVGLLGLALAPNGADACAEAKFYRAQFGLPERFDALVWRESRCTNTVISSTGCCVGYLQLHQIIFHDHRMTARLAACGATWANVRGDDPLSKQRQMCAAKQLYDVAGAQPWSTG